MSAGQAVILLAYLATIQTVPPFPSSSQSPLVCDVAARRVLVAVAPAIPDTITQSRVRSFQFIGRVHIGPDGVPIAADVQPGELGSAPESPAKEGSVQARWAEVVGQVKRALLQWRFAKQSEESHQLFAVRFTLIERDDPHRRPGTVYADPCNVEVMGYFPVPTTVF